MIFLRAMEKTVRSFPDVKALIIGDGQDRAMLEGFCLEKGLSDHVVFLGYQEKIGDYYQVLDLLVLPSLSEGLPNTVLEAMSFGVPVLAAGGRRCPRDHTERQRHDGPPQRSRSARGEDDRAALGTVR